MATQHKLDSLTIHGFQSIRRLDDFKLNDINILIGANGAGKSNFINYFRMLTELIAERLQVWVQKRGGADRLLTFGVKETREIYSYLKFGDYAYMFALEPTDEGSFIFMMENYFHKKHEFSLGGGLSESDLLAIHSIDDYEFATNIYNIIHSWKIFHIHDTSETAGVLRYGSLDDAQYLRTDASNLAAYLYRLKQNYPNIYNRIRKISSLAIPYFDDFILEPQTLRGDDQQIRLLWRQKDSDYPLWASQLSDGSIRFICLVTALLQHNLPSIIIIDEPELGLHPYAITLLAGLIRSASQHSQIIISTQSVQLLNEFNLEDLIVVEREQEVSVFKRLDKAAFEHWLTDYTVGQLWEKNIFGGRA